MDVRIVVKVGVKNQKNLLFHIRSVVNHSKTREQSFSMNSSYALNGTHEDIGYQCDHLKGGLALREE